MLNMSKINVELTIAILVIAPPLSYVIHFLIAVRHHPLLRQLNDR